ncbi:MAG: hypothetical protein ACFFF4_12620 [Candidatus Thorarchaeota archaeon]
MPQEKSLSTLTKAYVWEIERLAADYLQKYGTTMRIMDILSEDRENFKNIGIQSTGTSSGWTGHVYELLTTSFIKQGLLHLLDDTGWSEGMPFDKGYALKGTLGGSKKDLQLHLNSRIILGGGKKKRPDISLTLEDKFIAVLEIKSSVSNDRTELSRVLNSLCDYEASLRESPECVFSLVFYGLHWTIGALDEYSTPDNFMFISSNKLHGGTPDKESNFKGTRYDIGHLVQTLVKKIESSIK